MAIRERLRKEIKACIATLNRRADSSADVTEKAVIREVIAALGKLAQLPTRATPLQLATAITSAADQLEKTVAAVKMGPFDGYLSGLESHLTAINLLAGKVHAEDSLDGAAAAPRRGRKKAKKKPRKKARQAARPKRKPPASPGGALAGLESAIPAPAATALLLTSTGFADLRDEYQRLYDRCEVKAGNEGVVAFYLKRLRQGQPNYQLVEQQSRVPWVFVGIVHGMECGFNFAGHLHNGDPLTARTVQVPKNRPIAGSPPFTWLDSALDALRMKKLDQVTDWSVPHMLYLLEGYNGYGYRRRGLPSPYLWSFSSNYEKGKFVADGRYDPEAVSKQCGAALMMKKVLVN